MKTQSVLPNSSPEILRPFAFEGGVLQVKWIERIDAHGLFLSREQGETLLATHHNGYSCNALLERIIAGNLWRILDQAKYIRDCGGTTIGDRFLQSLSARSLNAA